MIVPIMNAALKIPIASPISSPLNQREIICSENILIVIAPVPAITLPNPAERKLSLTAKIKVPIINRMKETVPTLKGPHWSESKPTNMPNAIPGNAKRLISEPASAWVSLKSSITKVRIGGREYSAKEYTIMQTQAKTKITQRYLIDGIPHH